MKNAIARRRTGLCLGIILTTLACGDRETVVPPAMGTLERDRVELVAEAFEEIVEIAVREGDRVERDDLVMRLDPTRVEARLVKARAAIVEAEATLRLVARGPRAEEIEEGYSRLAGADGALVAAQSEIDRLQRLVDQGLDTPASLDRAQGRHDEALGRRDEARAALDALLVGTPREELDQARAALATAESVLIELEIDRSRLEIRAPISGRVDALPLKLGARPASGATIGVLLADQPPYARVHVPAQIWQRLTPGAQADVRIDGQSDLWEGRLRWISSDASFTPYYALTSYDRGRLSYLAEVDLTDTDATTLPTGVTVEVFFRTTGDERAEE